MRQSFTSVNDAFMSVKPDEAFLFNCLTFEFNGEISNLLKYNFICKLFLASVFLMLV